jgi:hypothetical protein
LEVKEKKLTSRTEKTLLCIVIVVFLVLFAQLFYSEVQPFLVANEANKELVDFYSFVKIGQAKEVVSKAFHEKQYKHLKISWSSWIATIRTPSQFGAQNWLAMIGFKDEIVSWKRVRTDDNPKVVPSGAPKDEGNFPLGD